MQVICCPSRMAGALLLVPLAGCAPGMHGMCGMEGMHAGAAHSSAASGPSVVKEVQAGAWTATIEGPLLHAGEDTRLALSVVDARTGLPQADLQVTFDMAEAGPQGRGHGTGHGAHAGPSSVRKTAAVEEPGVYAVRHRFSGPGPAAITATAASRDDTTLATVRVTQEVRQTGGGGGWSARSRGLVAGGAAMALVMALMLAWP
ncbi:MAG: hypothetical protein AB1505_00705 [Candidatus Latescibacterota bacterium]